MARRVLAASLLTGAFRRCAYRRNAASRQARWTSGSHASGSRPRTHWRLAQLLDDIRQLALGLLHVQPNRGLAPIQPRGHRQRATGHHRRELELEAPGPTLTVGHEQSGSRCCHREGPRGWNAGRGPRPDSRTEIDGRARYRE